MSIHPLNVSANGVDCSNLHPDSYTTHRLKHATPEHLHLTTRRCFIGPIPTGWLKSHDREWYKLHLHSNYSSRAATFSANTTFDHNRRLSGLSGPSSSATFARSFPQPKGLSKDHISEEEEDDHDRSYNGEPQRVSTETSLPVAPGSSNIDIASIPKNNPKREATNSTGVQEDPKPGDQLIAGGSHRPARTETTESFHTAKERPLKPVEPDEIFQESEEISKIPKPDADLRSVTMTDTRTSMAEADVSPNEPHHDVTSTSSLIQKYTSPALEVQSETNPLVNNVIGRLKPSGLVRFDVPKDTIRSNIQDRARSTQMKLLHASRNARRSSAKDGQIVKMEKMLIRVDTSKAQLPDEYDENESQKIDSMTLEKWREFMVVCREITHDEDAEFELQMYKTRVIPAIEKSQSRKKSKHQIKLSRKYTRVNLCSSLDKSVVVWAPTPGGTILYILQPRSSSSAVEWYTFIRNILGWHGASELQVNVPDLSVTLHVEDPFHKLESSERMDEITNGDDEAIEKVLQEEQAVATNIISQCMEMLLKSSEWTDIVSSWSKNGRMGLAWKRYDRLEWIHGPNERRMYGTIAMIKSHELELRPKQHYPTTTRAKNGEILTEPAPVEGFLVRLTSQRGIDRRFGRLLYRRLYFSSHDQYLVFSKPGNVSPPAPPTLPVPTSSYIAAPDQRDNEIPLIYDVDPYPVKDGTVEWLTPGRSTTFKDQQKHDLDAHYEAERKANLLLNCDGYIDLCSVLKIRNVYRGATTVDDDLGSGSDVDFEADNNNEDQGTTTQFDDDRTFELVMSNGLVIRLQSFNELTKIEWISRLRGLTKYWKSRSAADIQLYKSVRQKNLNELKIDEETESFMGQFARKWEVTKTYASADLYNMCGISRCRAIHVAGTLYRKPRRHSTFTRCTVLLVHGRLLLFQDTLRTRTGKEVAHIHHEKVSSLDLKDCYLYSGLLTENDLLYQNRTFDANKPGQHALPRIYLEDGWTSTDEDFMTTFVVWHGRAKGIFRSQGGPESNSTQEDVKGEGRRARLKLVSRLGVPGRSIVFRTRSRAERDHWVLAIQNEIERLSEAEEVRLTGSGKSA
ncbi:hypothetical protein M501DRAFT_1005394 [Patellaria atrata CBS 101060]|uniref:PH domain-containing protein n=1 Tax=Patellaria atrata CBS 101060 TaxID=1346257 RepID=A0A9P4SGR1_9PEZI|nr:hypothetical protein M501DRAFT_1005394 [Patellaria atrata CBS 101060]